MLCLSAIQFSGLKRASRAHGRAIQKYLIVKVPGGNAAAPRAIIAAREAVNDGDAVQWTELVCSSVGYAYSIAYSFCNVKSPNCN